MAAAGVVLAGGRSTRMGRPKADLEWHGETLLVRTVGVLVRALDGPVVVVRAPGQRLPPLPAGVRVLDDPAEGRGPLQGVAAGLRALAGEADVAFTCSTDLPFLHVAFVRAVTRALPGDADAAVPVVGGFDQPLAAAYRTGLAAAADALLAADRRRLGLLLEACRVRRLCPADLVADPAVAAHDPGLDSTVNVNAPGEYDAARARPAPRVGVRWLGGHGSQAAARTVRAAWLGQAAAAVSVRLDGGVTARVNGEGVAADAAVPLMAGDDVELAARGCSRTPRCSPAPH